MSLPLQPPVAQRSEHSLLPEHAGSKSPSPTGDTCENGSEYCSSCSEDYPVSEQDVVRQNIHLVTGEVLNDRTIVKAANSSSASSAVASSQRKSKLRRTVRSVSPPLPLLFSKSNTEKIPKAIDFFGNELSPHKIVGNHSLRLQPKLNESDEKVPEVSKDEAKNAKPPRNLPSRCSIVLEEVHN